MFQPVIDLLGWLMEACYAFSGSYGIAILLFTVLVKVIFLPLSVWQQKNSIKMVKIQPQVNQIKAQYINDSAKAGEEQLALYKKAGYRPLVGLIPTLIQIPLILGVISVVYQPLTYLLRIDAASVEALRAGLAAFLGTDKLGLAWQVQAVQLLERGELTAAAAAAGAPTEAILAALHGFQRTFLGCDLLQTPGLHGAILAYPALAIASTWLLCALQNRSNVLQREQEGFGRWGTSLLMIVLAAYLSFAVPAAAVLYWTAGNLLSIAVMYLMNAVIDPRRHIDYAALEQSKKVLAEAEKHKKTKKEIKEDARHSKEDYKRFFAQGSGKKELVFYSVRGGFYRYYKGLIEHILSDSDIVIHYVTSDAHDEIFSMQGERLRAYYIDGNDLIYWFMKLDADVMVMTMPELEKYYYKRSLVRKDIEYIYVFHAMVSTHMIYRTGAFDHYDTIFCVGPHHVREIRETERLYDLPEKRLIEFGYPMLDDLIESYRQSAAQKNDAFQVLIAPSHHDGNIMDSCLDALLKTLQGHGWRIVVRPHPQYVKRNPGRITELRQQYADAKEIVWETDFSTNESQYRSDVMITDWSGISMEFSFATLKPCIYIDTPMKVLNPDWEKYQNRPALLELRNKIGVSFSMEDVDKVGDAIGEIQQGKILNREAISQIVEEYVYHVGEHGKSGAAYIIGRIAQKRAGDGRAEGDETHG